jgi:hypothetical protein
LKTFSPSGATSVDVAGRRSHLGLFGILLVAVTWPWLAASHPMAESHVFLDLSREGVHVELRLPLPQLEIGFGRSLGPRPSEAVARLSPELRSYLASHLAAIGTSGSPWQTEIQAVRLAEGAPPELVAEAWLRPADGAPTRAFRFRYDVIVHELLTHRALVFIRRDRQRGATASRPELVGQISYRVHELVIDRAPRTSKR